MILPRIVKEKAEEFGKLGPTFLEGAKFALSNQWISVKDDLPCNHKDLLVPSLNGTSQITVSVLVKYTNGSMRTTFMVNYGDGWRWMDKYDTVKY